MRGCAAPVFKGRSRFACFLLRLTYAFQLVFLLILSILFPSHYVLCLRRQVAFRSRHCEAGNEDPAILLVTLEEWLNAHQKVRDAIHFENEQGTWVPYSAWSAEEKARLQAVFDIIVDARDAGLPKPLPGTAALLGSGLVFVTRLEPDVARDLFWSSLAQSLAAEIHAWVPWSLQKEPPDVLEDILHSRALFSLDSDTGSYVIDGTLLGFATSGDPARTFEFMRSNNLIGEDGAQTIVRLLDWGRDHLLHFLGDHSPQNYVDWWAFEGLPPVEHVIEGVTYTGTEFQNPPPLPPRSGHYSAGCWGTTGFLRSVLRSANLVVRQEGRCVPSHSLPHFVPIGKMLSHADNLYDARLRWEPRIPTEAILLDEARLDEWFAPGDDDCSRNIGRGVLYAIKQYLPYDVLRAHCRDQDNGLAHGDGEVFDIFDGVYDLAALEAEDLWGRIESEIAALGGCDSIP